jgi:hypothetical protein
MTPARHDRRCRRPAGTVPSSLGGEGGPFNAIRAPGGHHDVPACRDRTLQEGGEPQATTSARRAPIPRPREATPPQPREAEAAPPTSPAEASPTSELQRAGMTTYERPKMPEHDDPVSVARERGAPAVAPLATRDELMVSEAQRLSEAVALRSRGVPADPGHPLLDVR